MEVRRSEQEIYDARLRKAESLRSLGHDPYAAGHPVPDSLAEVNQRFGEMDAAGLEAQPSRVSVAGRIVAERSFGKAGFLKLRDRGGELQIYVKQEVLGEAAYQVVKLAESGDIVAAEGPLFRSKTNELTLGAEHFSILTKALRPLPEKWHGLTDVETRYRQRYLDLIANSEVRSVFLRRSQIVRGLRAFLDRRGFIEVETPMMHPLVSGATARPFRTHHNALEMDLYLRIAPELYLKRLVVGGFERVYEINRNFRNEGLSIQHNPEFTMVEFYQAYATYNDLMSTTEALLAELAQSVTGSAQVEYQGTQLDFGGPFRRLPMAEAVRQAFPALQPSDLADAEPLRRALLAARENRWSPSDRAGIEGANAGELVARLFEEKVEKTLIQPTFVTDFPVAISPLARRSQSDPQVTDRFELYVAGREIANAFTELNDPLDQRQRFEEQLRKRGAGDEEAMDFDADYIRALEQGMPPTAGEGIGVDRLVMLLTNSASIRDVILFPLLKKSA